MKKIQTTFLGLMTLALLAGPGIVKDANAGVRVNATLRTPNIHVRVGNTPHYRYRGYRLKRLPVRVHYVYTVNHRDRQIARRLARYTGVQTRELILLRRQGYRWAEIGRWLGLPRPVMRAAMHQKSWKRFIRDERRFARCDDDRYGKRGTIRYIDDEYDGD